MHTCISPNFDAQNPVGTSLTCTRPVCVFGFWLKIDLFSTCVQKFRQVDKLNLLKMFLRNILSPRHTCMVSNFGGKTPKIVPTTVQTIFSATIWHQNHNILCLRSNVWQTCNVKVTTKCYCAIITGICIPVLPCNLVRKI